MGSRNLVSISSDHSYRLGLHAIEIGRETDSYTDLRFQASHRLESTDSEYRKPPSYWPGAHSTQVVLLQAEV